MIESPNNKPSAKKSVDNLARFSAMGLQMGVTIFIFAWLGIKMDEWLNTSPIFTILLALLSVIGIMFIIIKQASKK